MKREREAYKALVDDHGRPCNPIELGLDVLDNPGQYKDIISYWQGEKGVSRLLFVAQLERWRKFREYQLKVRRYYIQRNRFPEDQRKVRDRRRRHELDGDVELLEDRELGARKVDVDKIADGNIDGNFDGRLKVLSGG